MKGEIARGEEAMVVEGSRGCGGRGGQITGAARLESRH